MTIYRGQYKGVKYDATETVQGDASGFLVTVEGITDPAFDAMYPNLSKAGHAVAAVILQSKGLPAKDPPARAIFAPEGAVQEKPAKVMKVAKEPKAPKVAKLTNKEKSAGLAAGIGRVLNGEDPSTVAGEMVKAERKRTRKATAPRQRRGNFVLSPNQAEVPEGSIRVFCNTCNRSFVCEGKYPPETCPEGHSNETFWASGSAMGDAPADMPEEIAKLDVVGVE